MTSLPHQMPNYDGSNTYDGNLAGKFVSKNCK